MKGIGSVYQARSNGASADIWLAKFRDRNGKLVVRSTKTRDKREALVELARLVTEDAAGKPVAKTTGRKNAWTFEIGREAFLHHYQTQNTPTMYGQTKSRVDRHLAPVFAGRNLADVTHDELLKYAADRNTAGAADSTVQLELCNLSMMFELGILAGRVGIKPKFPIKQLDNARQGFFEQVDFARVRLHLPDEYRDMMTIAYWTGWRTQAELGRLTWTSIDRDARAIYLDASLSKNKNGRIFPYAAVPEVAEAIERLKAKRDALLDRGIVTTHVFVDADGKPLVYWYPKHGAKFPKRFRKLWRRACIAAKVPERNPHDLRRTLVRNLVRSGTSEKVAQQLSGHKSRRVFERYNITNETDLRHATERLAAKYTPAPPPAERKGKRKRNPAGLRVVA